MPNQASRVNILQAILIEEFGLPVESIEVNDINSTPVIYTILWKPDATNEQIALGEQIASQFKWSRMRPLPRPSVVSNVGVLNATQRAIVTANMQADYLRANPLLAAKIGLALGVPLVVEEVDPTS